MKCNNCCFIFNDGTYEYPEPCCKVFGYDTPEIFYKEGGCCLHFKEAEKIANIYDELDGLQFFGYNFIKHDKSSLYTSNNWVILGTYSTKEKALKVLDMIQQRICRIKQTELKCNMLSVSSTTSLVFDGINNFVFEMPLENEIK